MREDRWPTLLRTLAPQLTHLTVNDQPMDEFLSDDVDEHEFVECFQTLTRLQTFKAHNIRSSLVGGATSPLANLLAAQADLRSLTLSQCSSVDQLWCKPDWSGDLTSLKVKACMGVGMDWLQCFSHKFARTLKLLEVKVNSEINEENRKICLPELTQLTLVGCSKAMRSFESCTNLRCLILGRGRGKVDFETLAAALDSWPKLKQIITLEYPDLNLRPILERCQKRGIQFQFNASRGSSHWQLRHFYPLCASPPPPSTMSQITSLSLNSSDSTRPLC